VIVLAGILRICTMARDEDSKTRRSYSLNTVFTLFGKWLVIVDFNHYYHSAWFRGFPWLLRAVDLWASIFDVFDIAISHNNIFNIQLSVMDSGNRNITCLFDIDAVSPHSAPLINIVPATTSWARCSKPKKRYSVKLRPRPSTTSCLTPGLHPMDTCGNMKIKSTAFVVFWSKAYDGRASDIDGIF
jgi:hypothetical protein